MTVEFKRLKHPDREVLRAEDLTEADLVGIRKAEPPAAAAAFDHEVTDEARVAFEDDDNC